MKQLIDYLDNYGLVCTSPPAFDGGDCLANEMTIAYCLNHQKQIWAPNPNKFIEQLDDFYRSIKIIPPLTDEKLREYKEFGRL